MVKEMASAPIADPNHCLDLAKEARALAEFMDDPKSKSTMLGIADKYELAAKKAETEQQARCAGSDWEDGDPSSTGRAAAREIGMPRQHCPE
jgi:hypothetical protein